MLVAVTRLRIRSLFLLPAFFWYARLSSNQARKSPGYIGGRLLNDANRTFWTMTAWDNEQSMRSYQNNGDHRRAMPKLQLWCDEAAVVHWITDSTELPGWDEGYQRLVKEGRTTRLTRGSEAHKEGRFPPLKGHAQSGVLLPKKS